MSFGAKDLDPALRCACRTQECKWRSFTDMCHACKYPRHMTKMIQLRHVPDALHRQLKARAALLGLPLSDYLVREVKKIAEQPTPEEMHERLRTREAYRGKTSLADIVRQERDAR